MTVVFALSAAAACAIVLALGIFRANPPAVVIQRLAAATIGAVLTSRAMAARLTLSAAAACAIVLALVILRANPPAVVIQRLAAPTIGAVLASRAMAV